MATNLKKSKKIRALIYRMIATGALFVCIASALMGREALLNLYREGTGTLTGNICYLTEFKEYITYLFQQGMVAYAGIDTDNDHFLSTEDAATIQKKYKTALQSSLNWNSSDILYYIKSNDASQPVNTNITYPIFSEEDGTLNLPDSVQLCCYWDGNLGLEFFGTQIPLQTLMEKPTSYGAFLYKPLDASAENIVIILAVKTGAPYSSLTLQKWDEYIQGYIPQLMVIFSSVALFVLFGFASLISLKQGKAARTDFAAFSGKIRLEVKLLCIALMLLFWYYNELGYIFASLRFRINHTPSLWLYLPLGALTYLLWTDLRIGKTKVFTTSLLAECITYLKEYAESLPWHRQLMTVQIVHVLSTVTLIVSGLFIRSNLGILFILTGLLLLFFSNRLREFIRDSKMITNKISELKEGQTSRPLVLPDHSLLTKTAEELNELDQGMAAAIEQQTRSNRLRVELITNVSHDLKTPLTSIINYADLLCEEDLPEPALGYAKTLNTKAYRLKDMVQDVFDLSKATSGNLPIEKNHLDFVKLIQQTLADMNGQIEESTLSFRTVFTEEPLIIEGDGGKLYRVFQNLFLNALQYSLEHSRVHIQTYTQDGYAIVKIKNTSKNELDFDPEEITERFVRADASRSTEGSGLGLSIARSFTEACGGTFTIQIDADMFTACVRFPLSEGTPPSGPKGN